MVEEIVLLNDSGLPIGTAPKIESHHMHTPLHQGFSCYLFNKSGEFLLTRRALSKKVWPGVWTNSVCGHPAPAEEIEDAVKRRAKYELGIDKISGLKVLLADYRYKTPPFNGIIENEACPVYIGVIDSELEPNRSEVEDFEWVDWAALKDDIKENSDKYSYWFKDQLKFLPKDSNL